MTAPALLLSARQIVANPSPDHSSCLRLLAWAALKSARGQTVCQRRLQAAPVTADRQVA